MLAIFANPVTLGSRPSNDTPQLRSGQGLMSSSEQTKDQPRDARSVVAEPSGRTASREAKIHLLLGRQPGSVGQRRGHSAIRDYGRRPAGAQ